MFKHMQQHIYIYISTCITSFLLLNLFSICSSGSADWTNAYSYYCYWKLIKGALVYMAASNVGFVNLHAIVSMYINKMILVY